MCRSSVLVNIPVGLSYFRSLVVAKLFVKNVDNIFFDVSFFNIQKKEGD
jgi:hypothetical protein